jgi:hypothetical protein
MRINSHKRSNTTNYTGLLPNWKIHFVNTDRNSFTLLSKVWLLSGPFVTKPTTTLKMFGLILCPIGQKHVRNAGNNSVTPVNKILLPTHRFTQNSRLLNGISLIDYMSKFTHIGSEICKMPLGYFTPLRKYDYHSVDFRETQVCSKTLYKELLHKVLEKWHEPLNRWYEVTDTQTDRQADGRTWHPN